MTDSLAAHQLDRLFIALADSGRRSMVEQLSLGPATVKELAAPMAMGLPSALKHLRVLEEGGIVVSLKRGRTRTYSMRPEAFHSLDHWVRQRETALRAAFDRLADAIAAFPDKDDLP